MDELDDDLLNEYVDGMLDEARQREVEAWLAQSPEARARLAELETLVAAFAGMTDLPLTTDLVPPVLAAIRAERVTAVPWWVRFVPLAQLLAVVLLLVFFWTTLQTWWQQNRWAVDNVLPASQLPDWAVGEMVRGWGTAVWQTIQISVPQFELPANQWVILACLALVVWLVGNRLLLGNRLLFTNPKGGFHG